MYVSAWVQPEEQNQQEMCIVRGLLQGIGLCNCGGRLGKTGIHRPGCEERQPGALRHGLKQLSIGEVSLSPEKPQLCFKGLSTD